MKDANCEMVAMESTGNYWKPVYNILEDEKIPVIIVNAQHIKGVPGRKTDVKDAEWIVDLVGHGLVKSSYIPSRDQRELREITRYRQELNRIQAVLEGANIKLGSVISDINGKSSINILKVIISGNTDPVLLSELACGTARNKIPELQKALKGSIKEHQIIMLRHQLEHVEILTRIVSELDEDIQKKLKLVLNKYN